MRRNKKFELQKFVSQMHYPISLKLIIWIFLLNNRPEQSLQQFPD